MRLFLITGHGRSGTHYMAELFKYFGFKVGRQKLEADGMSHNYPPVAAKNNYQYLIQVVRDPWKVAESTYLAHYSLPHQNGQRIPEILAGDGRSARVWRSDDDARLEKTIRSIVMWNEAIAKAGPALVVKVEEAEPICRAWLHDQGLEIKEHDAAPDHNVNARIPGGWDMGGTVPWDTLDDEHMEMLKKHCRTYGYKDSR